MRILQRGPISVLSVALCAISVVRADAQGVPGPCTDGMLPSGALSRICVPAAGWTGDLLVFAHGYVAFNQPLGFYHLQLPDGTDIPTLVQGLGFAFATTSYRRNGLAILEPVDDIRELVAAFNTPSRVARRMFVTGVSEGGAIAALLAERSPELFRGAVAACGPIGNFRRQLDYFGDFRVLFDYFFPGVIPGAAIPIPNDVIANWFTVHVPQVLGAIAANPTATLELLRVAHVPVDLSNPATIPQSVVRLLSYNVLGTNDAMARLGGNPFDNRLRWYFGSSNDLRLNLRVQRFSASRTALAALRPYETTGDLRIPLVTLHTTRDEIIPFLHELQYLFKVRPRGRGVFLPIPADRYGHCNFNASDLLTAFGAMLLIP